jgi:hypothetical protein
MKNTNKFVFPSVDDEALVELSDIVMPLPKPISAPCTEQQNRLYTFCVNFEDMNVRLMYFFILIILIIYLKMNTLL